MKWKIGNLSSTVVSDEVVINTNFPSPPSPPFSPAEDVEYYGGYLVCESIGNSNHASLIAAAPDMYEALKMVKEKYGKVANFWSHDLQQIREAIAKAEGRA